MATLKVYVPQVTSPQVFATIGGQLLEANSSWRMKNWETSLKLSIEAYKQEMDAYKAELKAHGDMEKALDGQMNALRKGIESDMKEERSAEWRFKSYNATKTQSADTTNATLAATNDRAKAGINASNTRFGMLGGNMSNPLQEKSKGFYSMPLVEVYRTIPSTTGVTQEEKGKMLTNNEDIRIAKAMEDGSNLEDAVLTVAREGKLSAAQTVDLLKKKSKSPVASSPAGTGGGEGVYIPGHSVGAQQVQRRMVADPLGRKDEKGNVYQVTEQEASVIIKEEKLKDLQKEKEELVKGRPVRPSTDVVGKARSIYYDNFEKLPAQDRKMKLNSMKSLMGDYSSIAAMPEGPEKLKARNKFLQDKGFRAPDIAVSDTVTEKPPVPWDEATQKVVENLEGKDEKLTRLLSNTQVGKQAKTIVDAAKAGMGANDLGLIVKDLDSRYPDDARQRTALKALVIRYGINQGLDFKKPEPQAGEVVVKPEVPAYMVPSEAK